MLHAGLQRPLTVSCDEWCTTLTSFHATSLPLSMPSGLYLQHPSAAQWYPLSLRLPRTSQCSMLKKFHHNFYPMISYSSSIYALTRGRWWRTLRRTTAQAGPPPLLTSGPPLNCCSSSPTTRTCRLLRPRRTAATAGWRLPHGGWCKRLGCRAFCVSIVVEAVRLHLYAGE